MAEKHEPRNPLLLCGLNVPSNRTEQPLWIQRKWVASHTKLSEAITSRSLGHWSLAVETMRCFLSCRTLKWETKLNVKWCDIIENVFNFEATESASCILIKFVEFSTFSRKPWIYFPIFSIQERNCMISNTEKAFGCTLSLKIALFILQIEYLSGPM